MTGVYGLNWFPTGPDVLGRILRWMGFAEVRLAARRTQTVYQREGFGGMRVIASRREGLLGAFESIGREGDFEVMPPSEVIKGRELPKRRKRPAESTDR